MTQADEPRQAECLPGDALLHPVALGAMALLFLNDHYLKHAAPTIVTGKLSDFAGLAFFPLLLLGVVELAGWLAGRWRGPEFRIAIAATVATGVVFALVKTSSTGAAWFGTVLALGQWLVGLPGAILAGSIPPVGAPARVVADPTDVVALIALAVPLIIARRRAASAAGR